MITLRSKISLVLQYNDEDWDDIFLCTLSNIELDSVLCNKCIDDNFTIWTYNFVYYPSWNNNGIIVIDYASHGLFLLRVI